MTDKLFGVSIDCGTGEITEVPLSSKEAKERRAQQAEAENLEAERKQYQDDLEAKVAEMRVLGDTLRSGKATDAERDRALQLLLETSHLAT